MTKIETIYCARIHYDTVESLDVYLHARAVNAVKFAALKFAKTHDVDAGAFKGDCCRAPYIALFCESKVRLVRVVGMIERYILRRKRLLKLAEKWKWPHGNRVKSASVLQPSTT